MAQDIAQTGNNDARQKRFEARARAAKLRHDAKIKRIDFQAARGPDRNPFLKLAGCDWIRQRHSLRLIWPAGVSKNWLGSALGHKACREDISVAYHRRPRLFASLALAAGDRREPASLTEAFFTDPTDFPKLLATRLQLDC